MSTILTGLRANGDFHLGNYLGSMLPMVSLQKSLQPEDKFHMFIADLHSFTTPVDFEQLKSKIDQNIRMYIAAGIDPDNSQTVLYRQSYVPAHSELNWILSCFAHHGELSRMVEFKEKMKRLDEGSVGAGLFNYPVLMAADILLYDVDYVPLGDDQKQHMELTRTLANRLNHQFEQELFVVPKPWAEQLEFTKRSESVRIRSLAHPEAKMSKSVADPRGTINLLEDPQVARKKVMSATTDSLESINFDWAKQPGITNLLQTLALLSKTSLDEVKSEWTGQTQYGGLKKAVADVVEAFLIDFQAKYNDISDSQVEAALKRGEATANDRASAKLQAVQAVLGLR